MGADVEVTTLLISIASSRHAQPGSTSSAPIHVKVESTKHDKDHDKSVADTIKSGELLRYGVSIGAALQPDIGVLEDTGA